jgi:hypothetical protein
MVCIAAPAGKIVMIPVYNPGARPAGLTCAFKVLGVEPLVGFTASQLAVLEADAVKVVDEPLRENGCALGFGSPT